MTSSNGAWTNALVAGGVGLFFGGPVVAFLAGAAAFAVGGTPAVPPAAAAAQPPGAPTAPIVSSSTGANLSQIAANMDWNNPANGGGFAPPTLPPGIAGYGLPAFNTPPTLPDGRAIPVTDLTVTTEAIPQNLWKGSGGVGPGGPPPRGDDLSVQAPIVDATVGFQRLPPIPIVNAGAGSALSGDVMPVIGAASTSLDALDWLMFYGA